MDFQNISFQINKEKNAGKVLFIVEGEKTEKRYLYFVFHRILGYDIIPQRRRSCFEFDEFILPNSKNSRIYIAFANESNIKNIAVTSDYLNELFGVLKEKYDFDSQNAAIYYLWDRDVKSNTDASLIKSLCDELRSSRNENESFRQGLLLLSYPSIEAFYATNFIDKLNGMLDYTLGDELKQYLHYVQLTNCKELSEDTLIGAANYFINELLSMGISSVDLDDMSSTNTEVFNWQEASYLVKGKYHLLSMLIIAFLDLGIIESFNVT